MLRREINALKRLNTSLIEQNEKLEADLELAKMSSENSAALTA